MYAILKSHTNKELIMGSDNKKKSTANGKKEDSTFRSKHIKHDPQAESARAVYGLNSEKGKDNGERSGTF